MNLNMLSSLSRFASQLASFAAVAVALTGVGAAHAQVVSVDIAPNNGLAFGTTPTAMGAAELAGAPGVRVGNWNNANSTSYSSSSLLDNSGSLASGLSVAFTPGNGNAIFTRNNVGSASVNDYNLFNTVMDQFNGTPFTIALSGISYSSYDVYFYLFPDPTSSSPRGGHITIGSTTYYVNGGNNGGGNAVAMPDSSGNGYVLSSATTLADSLLAPGNYVKFSGLTGASLSASLVADNFGDGVPRLKIAGFQIAAVPEPSVAAMAGGFVGLLAVMRSRSQR